MPDRRTFIQSAIAAVASFSLMDKLRTRKARPTALDAKAEKHEGPPNLVFATCEGLYLVGDIESCRITNQREYEGLTFRGVPVRRQERFG